MDRPNSQQKLYGELVFVDEASQDSVCSQDSQTSQGPQTSQNPQTSQTGSSVVRQVLDRDLELLRKSIQEADDLKEQMAKATAEDKCLLAQRNAKEAKLSLSKSHLSNRIRLELEHNDINTDKAQVKKEVPQLDRKRNTDAAEVKATQKRVYRKAQSLAQRMLKFQNDTIRKEAVAIAAVVTSDDHFKDVVPSFEARTAFFNAIRAKNQLSEQLFEAMDAALDALELSSNNLADPRMTPQHIEAVRVFLIHSSQISGEELNKLDPAVRRLVQMPRP